MTALHLLSGLRYDAAVSWSQVGAVLALATAGNLVGGLVFVTLTHIGQAKPRREG